MPIELEYKFLLDNHLGEETLTNYLIDHGISFIKKEILQAYLPAAGRLRKISQGDQVTHMFTFKHSLSYQPGDLEIETTISKEDFDLGFRDCVTIGKKTRIVFSTASHTWEVDFFENTQGSIYGILLECEVTKEGEPNTLELPDIILNNILIAAPLGDKRFFNKNFFNEQKVKEIYETGIVS